ncbi:MAG: iron-containing redox enzyme family protein [Burkholderiales bacterium]|nr:iron-containing redox enzyme family protein [Burkholderiales bacterium]
MTQIQIALEKPLPEMVLHLAEQDGARLDAVFIGTSDGQRLLKKTQDICAAAYIQQDASAEYELQSALYQMLLMSTKVSGHQRGGAEDSGALYAVRTMLENAFIASEDAKIEQATLDSLDPNPEGFAKWLVHMIESHPAHRHPVYEEALAHASTVDDLKFFLAQEVTMDANTDDFLALLQVGVPTSIKATIAANYWDEMGYGDPEKMHSRLFARAVQVLGASVAEGAEIDIGALVCGNMQILLSMKRRYFEKGTGFFLACEYMAPKRFKSLMSGWNRNGLPMDGAGYHEVHIPLDVEHADAWIREVIIPIVEAEPAAAQEVARGLYYRLNTSQRYLAGC